MPEQEETCPMFVQKNEEIRSVLERSRTHLLKMAWQQVSQIIKTREDADLIVDEIAVMERDIRHPQAYLQKILENEVISSVRKRQIALSLPLDNENELAYGEALVAVSKGMNDPLYELEQLETTQELLEKIIELAVSLPHRQKWALISSLKERIDDLAGLLDALNRHNLDADGFMPPSENEIPTYRTSLSIARKKLRERLNQLLDAH
jgi:DNA-directed RNA polymerase specialized sigma24 family protein